MKLYGKAPRRIYLMKDTGKGTVLVPDYRYIYSVCPDKPTEIPDDIAKMLLEQNPDILSKHPFLVMEEKENKEPENTYKSSEIGHSGKSQVLEITMPIKKESDEQKPKKEPIPGPEIPKGKPIANSPIPD